MSILSLDVGKSYIGIAINPDGSHLALPVENYKRKTVNDDMNHIIDIINNREVHLIIVGFPLNLDGSVGDQALYTDGFKRRLEKKIKYSSRCKIKPKIEFEDERFSTKEAKALLHEQHVKKTKMRKKVDAISAQIILQSYLDAKELSI